MDCYLSLRMSSSSIFIAQHRVCLGRFGLFLFAYSAKSFDEKVNQQENQRSGSHGLLQLKLLIGDESFWGGAGSFFEDAIEMR